MVKACLNCGALPLPHARYCRQCGIPLIAPFATDDDVDEVSPRAPTLPFEPEISDTDVIDDASTVRGSNDTNRMLREEFDALLLRGNTTGSLSNNSAVTPPEGVETDPAPVSSGTAGLRESSKGDETRIAGEPNRARFRLTRMRVAAAVLIGFAVVVGLLATFRVIPGKRLGAHGPAPNAIEDHAKTFDEELAVAEQLIAGGNSAGATEHLGIASGLVPNLAADYVRLGKALLKVGDREKAFSSLKAAVEIDPDNREGWQALGDAQLGLGLYSEAVESYRHLIEGQPREGRLGELQHSFWLKYADALRMSGRSEEANLAFDRVYGTRDQKNSNASSAAHATIQKEKRAESSYVPMPRFQEMHGPTSPVNTARIEAPARVTNSPSPAPVVVPRRANERNPDDLFSEGIKILNGRDPRSLQRAELVRALELFQFASQGGAHRAEANRYADRLGREFDRRKKW